VTGPEWLRRGAARIAGKVRRHPGTALVRLDAPPAAFPPRRALPAPTHPLCPHCGTRHPPSLPSPWSSWSTSLLPDLGRPAPLHRGPVDNNALKRDAFNPWRA
jgi:hypothetical protein